MLSRIIQSILIIVVAGYLLPGVALCAPWTVQVFNIDDTAIVRVNGTAVLRSGYGESRERNIDEFLKIGENTVAIEIINNAGGYTYGYSIKDAGKTVFSDSCGQAGQRGCNNNSQQTGTIYSRVYKIIHDPSIRLHLWLSAFIPKSHPSVPGYVRRLETSESRWVIPGPTDDSCFNTDNRNFESTPTASARMTSELILVIHGNQVKVELAEGRPIHRIGATHKVDCKAGKNVVPSKTADNSRMHDGDPALADGIAQIVFGGSAGNPLVPAAPWIDYGMDVQFNTRSKELSFKATIGYFPSFEAYAQLDNGPVVTLFQKDPEGTSRAWKLIDMGTGANTRFFTGKVQLR